MEAESSWEKEVRGWKSDYLININNFPFAEQFPLYYELPKCIKIQFNLPQFD